MSVMRYRLPESFVEVLYGQNPFGYDLLVERLSADVTVTKNGCENVSHCLSD